MSDDAALPLVPGEPLLLPLVPAAPAVTATTTTTTTGLPPRPPPSWISRHVTNIIALVLTGMVCYLAYRGETSAQAALIAAFSVLVGLIFGARTALKIPNVDS